MLACQHVHADTYYHGTRGVWAFSPLVDMHTLYPTYPKYPTFLTCHTYQNIPNISLWMFTVTVSVIVNCVLWHQQNALNIFMVTIYILFTHFDLNLVLTESIILLLLCLSSILSSIMFIWPRKIKEIKICQQMRN